MATGYQLQSSTSLYQTSQKMHEQESSRFQDLGKLGFVISYSESERHVAEALLFALNNRASRCSYTTSIGKGRLLFYVSFCRYASIFQYILRSQPAFLVLSCHSICSFAYDVQFFSAVSLTVFHPNCIATFCGSMNSLTWPRHESIQWSKLTYRLLTVLDRPLT